MPRAARLGTASSRSRARRRRALPLRQARRLCILRFAEAVRAGVPASSKLRLGRRLARAPWRRSPRPAARRGAGEGPHVSARVGGRPRGGGRRVARGLAGARAPRGAERGALTRPPACASMASCGHRRVDGAEATIEASRGRGRRSAARAT